jgi:hypothetical protein
MESLDLKAREQAKREAAWNPAERWKLIQETISWAEASMKPQYRRNVPRMPRALKARRLEQKSLRTSA